jgi:hypothetical protein
MKTPDKYIFQFSLLFLFAACRVKHRDNQLTQFSFPPTKSQTVNTVIGKWKCTNIFMYSSELTLAHNGTFTFHDHGCLGRKFSEGKWSNSNGKILLTSFDSFKEEKQTTATNCFPGPNDTVKAYFHDIQMELKNDSLSCSGQNKLPEGNTAKFHRVTNTDLK